jgi:hypothetical protein
VLAPAAADQQDLQSHRRSLVLRGS